MGVLDLLPAETIKSLVAQGVVSSAAAKQARLRSERNLLNRELREIDNQVGRASKSTSERLMVRELQRLMTSFLGDQPPGTSVRKESRRWRQRTWMP
jgi:hypothetical protein